MESPVNGELVPQGGGDSISLARSPLVLGRRETCDVCLEFPNVSGKHCELEFKDGFWHLRDLGSTNGTKVNGARVTSKVLRAGDMLTIGKRRFCIQYVESGDASAVDDAENEVLETMNTPLLDKAGLAHPPKHVRHNPNNSRYDLDD